MMAVLQALELRILEAAGGSGAAPAASSKQCRYTCRLAGCYQSHASRAEGIAIASSCELRLLMRDQCRTIFEWPD